MVSFKMKKNEPKEWIAGIYLRVSTFDQAREGHSYEEQEKIYVDYVRIVALKYMMFMVIPEYLENTLIKEKTFKNY